MIRSFQQLYVQGGHFFNNDPGTFDATFFSITAKEAAAMDPQQRMAIEASYHAFENGKPYRVSSLLCDSHTKYQDVTEF